MKSSRKALLSEPEDLILTVRGQKVLLDAHLATLYGVSTTRFNEAVKRNAKRFPSDFRFQLSAAEWELLRSQIATANRGPGGTLKRPWVFTEHGAVMAANIIRTEKAIQTSVYVVRAFIKMRRSLGETAVLAAKLSALEKEVTMRLDSHEKAIVELMQQFFKILNPSTTEPLPDEPKREIGFHVKDKSERASQQSRRAR